MTAVEGNSSFVQVYPVRRMSGDRRRAWGPRFGYEGAGGGGGRTGNSICTRQL